MIMFRIGAAVALGLLGGIAQAQTLQGYEEVAMVNKLRKERELEVLVRRQEHGVTVDSGLIEKARADLEEAQKQVGIAKAQFAWSKQVVERMRQAWKRPSSVTGRIAERLSLKLSPKGEVLSATIDRAYGDQELYRSIEQAAMAASPLPLPEDAAAFLLSFDLRFCSEPADC